MKAAAAGEIVATGPIVAKAGRYYRVARYLMTLLLIAYGAWSIYDGFYSWPNWPITHPRERPKTDTDIALNKILGVVLPPVGISVLVWALYSSRGQYRLENGVANVRLRPRRGPDVGHRLERHRGHGLRRSPHPRQLPHLQRRCFERSR